MENDYLDEDFFDREDFFDEFDKFYEDDELIVPAEW